MADSKIFWVIGIVVLVLVVSSGKIDFKELFAVNPASTYCIEQGGELEIRTNPDGSQYSVCVFPDFECDTWAFYRGECGPEPEPECITNLDCGPQDSCFPGDVCMAGTCGKVSYAPPLLPCEGAIYPYPECSWDVSGCCLSIEEVLHTDNKCYDKYDTDFSGEIDRTELGFQIEDWKIAPLDSSLNWLRVGITKWKDYIRWKNYILGLESNCEDFTYSNCPDDCIKKCISSSCSGGICIADCDGVGSCRYPL